MGMKVKKMPSPKEVFKFMVENAKPYRFEFVEEIQPLRVNVAEKKIYVNREVLMDVIKDLLEAGLDWKEVMKKNLMHEKAHELYQKYAEKWGVEASDYGWLPSFLIDVMIDRVHLGKDQWYQKWLIADSRHSFRKTTEIFKDPKSRPQFVYNQAAYWIAIGAITEEEAISAYPEKAKYIMELSDLMKRIRSEKDLDEIFLKAKKLYLENFI